jgi:hypothetical protein
MSSLYQSQSAEPTPWHSLKAMADPDLIGIALFSALGLLISLYVIIRYPEFGSIIAQINQL